MGNFNKNSKSEGRSGSGRAGRPRRAGTEKREEKAGYKAKRSFTKNKSFREDKNNERPRRSYGDSDSAKPFRRPFKTGASSEDSAKSEKPFRREKKSFEEKPGSGEYRERKRPGTDRDKPERSKRAFGSENKERKEGSFDRESRPARRRDDDSAGTRERAPRRDSQDGEKSYGKGKYGDRKKTASSRDDKPERSKRVFTSAEERSRTEEGSSDRESRPSSRGERESGGSYGKDQYSSDRKGSGSSWDKPRKDRNDSERPERPREDKFGGFKKAADGTKKRGAKEEGSTEKKKRFTKPRKDGDDFRRVKHDEFEEGKTFSKQDERGPAKRVKKAPPVAKQTGGDGLVRLNKYLSNAGVASRREADNLILSGAVKVNGIVVNQLGTKINPSDKVSYGDESVRTERKVYLLLNKPKDYITTVEDDRDRKTVMELIKGACKERVYPVGRLDRNTTGLLLLTNDGDLTKKLTHPKFGVKKVYHVSLNKGLRADDFKSIIEGIELEDGMIKVDDLAFVGEGKKEIGIEIHSGRNRIVRRIFEHLGYDVLKLDRVVFAGLTKKDLPRGKHRFLTNKEVSFLQMIG